LLDFAKTKFMDPRVTFTRSSVATVTDSLGVIRTVASDVPRFDHDPVTGESLGLLMEESRTNLITYSDRFDNAAWIKTNVSVIPNSMLSPNGMFTASKVVESTVNGSHAINLINGLPITSGTQYVYGFYAKAGERNIIAFSMDGGAWGGTSQKAAFNLTTGVSTLNLGATNSGMKLLGNGWYSCWLVTAAATSSTTVGVRFYIRESANVEVYTGDGTSGVFLARAGLEAGAFPTSSIETPAVFTGRSSTGTFIGSNGLIQTAASGVARYQYTPSDLTIPPYLLLESVGTNLLIYSSDFTNSVWTSANNRAVQVSATGVLDPAGGTTAATYRHGGISNNDIIFRSYTGSIGVAYVYSIFIKRRVGSGNVTFTVGDNIGVTFQITSQWVRYFSTNIPTSTSVRAYIATTVDGDEIDVWGAQLEVGDRPSTYIPTTTSQVTRAADTSTSSQVTRAADSAVMTGVNFSSWYRQDEGTFFVNYRLTYKNTNADILSISNGTSSELIQVRLASDSAAQYTVRDNGVVQANLSPSGYSSLGVDYLRSVTYKTNDFASSINASAVLTDTNGTLPTVNKMDFAAEYTGNVTLNGTIKKVAFYPKRLTNTELVGNTQ
jgi:hypothetical protein